MWHAYNQYSREEDFPVTLLPCHKNPLDNKNAFIAVGFKIVLPKEYV